MKLQRIVYKELSAKQKEIYNFQRLASVLALYGFNCIKLDDDWQGADFLAYHKDGTQTLRVQLKGRLTIAEKYRLKKLYIAFSASGRWYLVPHDDLVAIINEETTWLTSLSWVEDGHYSRARPPRVLMNRLTEYALDD